LFTFADRFDPGLTVVSLRAPLTQRPGAYAWFPVRFTADGPVIDEVQAEESRRLLVDFLRQAPGEFGTDPGRTVVVGFSQGAILAASVALTEPELVAGAVLMSGRILPEVLPLVAPPARRTGPAWLIVHGTEDQVLPVTHGRASLGTLRSLGLDPEYQEFPLGHGVSAESLGLVTGWVNRRAAGT